MLSHWALDLSAQAEAVSCNHLCTLQQHSPCNSTHTAEGASALAQLRQMLGTTTSLMFNHVPLRLQSCTTAAAFQRDAHMLAASRLRRAKTSADALKLRIGLLVVIVVIVVIFIVLRSGLQALQRVFAAADLVTDWVHVHSTGCLAFLHERLEH